MVAMKVLADRKEWLANRKKYIGGSDSASVVGYSPWKNNVELWEEKTDQLDSKDIEDKTYVKFGIEAEPIMRELFKINYPQYDMFYVDNNSWTNDKYPFAAVSHDGWLEEKATGRKGIWECKKSEIFSSTVKEKWKDKIPNNYYCQILHSLMIREDCEFAVLTALLTWNYGENEVYQQVRNYHIERADVEDDIKYLAEAEAEFWEQVQRKERPALLLPEI